jgi:hypothetical protein
MDVVVLLHVAVLFFLDFSIDFLYSISTNQDGVNRFVACRSSIDFSIYFFSYIRHAASPTFCEFVHWVCY